MIYKKTICNNYTDEVHIIIPFPDHAVSTQNLFRVESWNESLNQISWLGEREGDPSTVSVMLL